MSGGLAIIGGTGVGSLDIQLRPRTIATEYGDVVLDEALGAYDGLWFLSRHGPGREWPPHKIAYRANIRALQEVGVERVVATFAVGSVDDLVPPGTTAVIDQFIDLTSGRDPSFFEGGEPRTDPWWLDLSDPFCADLRHGLLEEARSRDVPTVDGGTYVCFNGPRLETTAEIKMAKILGGHVAGMTLAPEAPLAAEAGMHYAGIAVSINWCAGVAGDLKIDTAAQARMREQLFPVMLAALQRAPQTCRCHQRKTVT